MKLCRNKLSAFTPQTDEERRTSWPGGRGGVERGTRRCSESKLPSLPPPFTLVPGLLLEQSSDHGHCLCVGAFFTSAVIGLAWTHHGVKSDPRKRDLKIHAKPSGVLSAQMNEPWCELRFHSALTQPHLCPGAPLTTPLCWALEGRKPRQCIWEVSDSTPNSCRVETYWP